MNTHFAHSIIVRRRIVRSLALPSLPFLLPPQEEGVAEAMSFGAEQNTSLDPLCQDSVRETD